MDMFRLSAQLPLHPVIWRKHIIPLSLPAGQSELKSMPHGTRLLMKSL
uniref:Kinesin-related protein 11-like isoform X2 n=1 Tax=Rhizophora mucronata TaxID=61149 RepID=A0A2P2M331_RHIMU